MSRKLIILGVGLLLVGSAGVGWVAMESHKEQLFQAGRAQQGGRPVDYDDYVRTKTESELRQEQQERLKADLQKLAAGETDESRSADLLYGKGWKQAVSKYKAKEELRGLILTASSVTVFAGLAVLGGSFSVWALCAARRTWRKVKKGMTDARRHRWENRTEEVTANEERVEETCGTEARFDSEGERAGRVAKQGLVMAGREEDRGRWTALETEISEVGDNDAQDSPWMRRWRAARGKEATAMESQPIGQDSCEDPAGVHPGFGGQSAGAPEANSETVKLMEPLVVEADSAKPDNVAKTAEKFDRLAESVKQSDLRDEETLGGTLKDLAQQVSAIRQYAADQQERVTKLQDGYDWNIIRNFCLKLIRCIDNLECRISQLSGQGIDTADLEEVRDELIFSLESSGVEQFEAEIHSDYCGQEKRLEAVKEREHCDDPALVGKIAEVVRPGYQYVIDEENVKIVRAAQVRLLG